jgi:glucose-6-phosphate dehydrogenase assembly protein OpcA
MRLRAEHQGRERLHAAARTMNVVVAPCRGNLEDRVIEEIARLGSHSPARSIVLRDQTEDRLDAEIVIECESRPEAGRVGICHDRIVLDADLARLAHADSLIAPLLVADLPTVLWLPDPGFGDPDPRLVDRAKQVVLDSGEGEGGLEIAAGIAKRKPVCDLAWIRLERWRAAVASAWDPPGRRPLLAELDAVEVTHGSDATADAALAAGWIVARTGIDPAIVSLTGPADGPGNGTGIDLIVFRAGSHELPVRTPPDGPSEPEQFARALIPAAVARRGYPEALAAARSL